MKEFYQLEVILFSRNPSRELRRKELLNWLRTTAQYAIDCQHEKAKKLFLKNLKDSAAIYLS